jgi:hypothetical protein
MAYKAFLSILFLLLVLEVKQLCRKLGGLWARSIYSISKSLHRYKFSMYISAQKQIIFTFPILPFLQTSFESSKMRWSLALVIATRFLSPTFSSPIQAIPLRPEKATVSNRATPQYNPVDLDNEFKGIDWNHMFGEGKCTPEQIDRLVTATRASMTMLERPIQDANFYYSEAWNRYFFPYEHWLTSGHDSLMKSRDIIRKSLYVCVSASDID